MSETVWIKHPETGHVSEVPEAALPNYRQSGWDVMSEDELAERNQALAEEAAEAEQRNRLLGLAALPADHPAVADADELREQGESAVETTNSPTAVELGAVPGPSNTDDPNSDAVGRRSKKGNA
jgi:hypothetical protein